MQKQMPRISLAGETKPADKLQKLEAVLRKLIQEEFTGHIKINFTQGGIGRIEKFEEILRGK